MTRANQTILTIRIPGFQESQKDIKRRRFIALDCCFFSNPKIRDAKRHCPDSILCYQWLLMNADYQSESYTIKESSLKAEWMDVCGSSSNRFDINKRLKALTDSGLIDVEITSNEVPIESQFDSNCSLTESKRPLEQAENLVALSPFKGKEKKINNPPTPHLGGVSFEFEKFWTEYPKKIAKQAAWKAWQRSNLDNETQSIIQALIHQKPALEAKEERFIPHASTWLNQRRWEDDIKHYTISESSNKASEKQLKEQKKQEKLSKLRESAYLMIDDNQEGIFPIEQFEEFSDGYLFRGDFYPHSRLEGLSMEEYSRNMAWLKSLDIAINGNEGGQYAAS